MNEEKRTMIHAYFTNGMFDLATVFLKSLYDTNGDLFRVLLSTRDLTDEQITTLKTLYPALEVENKLLDMERFAERAQVTVDQLWEYRREVETRYVTHANKVWKLMIAAEDRPRSLHDLLLRGEGVCTPILHFDIDTLFRKNIWPLVSEALKHDCCLLLRPEHNVLKARITISTMTFRRTDAVMEFFDRWMYWLDRCLPPMRPIGYGQSSCWYAFKEVEEKLNYSKLGPAWGYPGLNKAGNFIWSGAVHKLTKEECAKKFREELR